jgi:DUF4097 and DUF4098 domain-containing protein YvlB
MTKQDYLQALNDALQTADEAARDEFVHDFEEHFAIGKANGRSDDDIIASLGPIDELIAALDLPPKPSKAIPNTESTGQAFTGITAVEVDSLHADVSIKPSSDNQTRVTFENDGKLVDKLAYSTEVVQRGQTLLIKVEPVKRFFLSSASDLTIVIAVASTVQQLRLESASGDLEVADVALNQLNVKSASGDVQTHRVIAQRFEGSTASGDLHFERCRGELMINTASGSVYAKGHDAAEAQLRSASGDLNYEGRCPNLYVNTASGDGRLDLTGADQITIHSVAGDFDIDVDRADEGLSAVMKSVSGDLVVRSPEGTYQADRHKDAITLKGGAVRINLKSVTADFKIRQHV